MLVNFDMEQFAVKDLTLTLFERCCEAIDFPAGLAVQAYLRSGMDDIERVIAWAKRSGRQVTVRLIKGAYWDYETINAERMDWPVPVWSEKRETDACFERMAAADRRVDAAKARRRRRQTGHSARTTSARSPSCWPCWKSTACRRRPYETQKLSGMGDQLRAALEPARPANPRVRARSAR